MDNKGQSDEDHTSYEGIFWWEPKKLGQKTVRNLAEKEKWKLFMKKIIDFYLDSKNQKQIEKINNIELKMPEK